MKHPQEQTVLAKFLHKMIIEPLKSLLRFLFLVLLQPAQDPAPEAPGPKNEGSSGIYGKKTDWGWLPFLALLSTIGLLCIALGFTISRNTGTTKLRYFIYPGLILLFAPVAFRLLVPSTSRHERILLLCITGLNCYLIKVLTSPLHFYLYDEFLHWRTATDMASNRHFFTPNSLLPVSPYYPGLETVTNALSMVSGLDIFHSSLILIGIARLMTLLTLFIVNEELFHSARVASLATMLYMLNPHFLFFDTQYAYESLALPLALLIFLLLAPYQSLAIQLKRLHAVTSPTIFLTHASRFSMAAQRRNVRYIRGVRVLLALLVLCSVTFTHHSTNFFFIALLLLWSAIHTRLHLSRRLISYLTGIAITGMIVAILWATSNNNPVVAYLTGFLSSVFNHPGKHFVSSAVNAYAPHAWEKDLSQYSTYLILACLPFGLLCLWQRYRSQSMIVMLGITALGLPTSQVLRMTDNGIQLADRASAILFVAVSSVLAIFIVQFWPVRKLRSLAMLILTGAMTTAFIGGYIASGGGGFGSPPTPYVVGADSRSIEPEGIQAALWAHAHLGPNNRIGTDRTNQLLMATYGDQRIVDVITDHVDVASIFSSLPLDANSLQLMRKAHIHYLVVDQRLAQSLPAVGVYFEKDEPDAFQHTRPISLDALMKFDTMPQVNKVFDSGQMVIFDVQGLSHAQTS